MEIAARLQGKCQEIAGIMPVDCRDIAGRLHGYYRGIARNCLLAFAWLLLLAFALRAFARVCLMLACFIAEAKAEAKAAAKLDANAEAPAEAKAETKAEATVRGKS